MSNSLRPHGLQHTRPPYPSLFPGVCSNSCPLSWWCHPTISSSVTPFSSCPQSFLALEFQRVGSSYEGPKYWSLSFSISPSNEYSGLISFRVDWFDLLAVQGTLKSLLQHYSLKALILWCSAFFIDQLSHLYMTTGKTTAMNMLTYVGKVMSPLFNSLFRFVITFLSRNNHHVIWWLLSPSAVILESKKIKFATFPIFSPSIFH